MTPDQILDYIVEARRGDEALGRQLYDLTRDLAADPAQPSALHALS